jgi:hypothetical protein
VAANTSLSPPPRVPVKDWISCNLAGFFFVLNLQNKVKVKIPNYPPVDQNLSRESFISLEEFPVTDPVAGSPRLADSSRIISRSHSRWLATTVSLVLLFSQASCYNIMVTKYKPLLLLQDSHQ